MKIPVCKKFDIYQGEDHSVISTADELYLLYNDFVSINDEKHDCDPELTEIIETIRDDYRQVFDLLPGGIYQIEEFEAKAIEALKGGK